VRGRVKVVVVVLAVAVVAAGCSTPGPGTALPRGMVPASTPTPADALLDHANDPAGLALDPLQTGQHVGQLVGLDVHGGSVPGTPMGTSRSSVAPGPDVLFPRLDTPGGWEMRPPAGYPHPYLTVEENVVSSGTTLVTDTPPGTVQPRREHRTPRVCRPDSGGRWPRGRGGCSASG
jgi:hypothetical protein